MTYTFGNVLGDIGGVLGLFLGASVFTVLEFIQVGVFALNKHCISLWRGRVKRDNGESDEKKVSNGIEKDKEAQC